jgi:O-antigen/teichoic acid export membrane protein
MKRTAYAAYFPLIFKGSAFLQTILIARELGPGGMGLLAAIQTAASVCAVVGTGWAVNYAVQRAAAAGPAAGAPPFPFWVVATIAAMASLLFTAVFTGLLLDIDKRPIAVAFAGVLYVFSQINAAACIAVVVTRDPSLRWLLLVLFGATLGLSLTPILVKTLGVAGALAAIALIHSVITLVSFIRYGVQGRAEQAELSKAKFSEHVPLLLTPLALAIAQLAAMLVVLAKEGGPVDVGIFNVAFQWKTFLLFFPVALSSVHLAAFVRQRQDTGAVGVSQVIRPIVFNIVCVGLIAIPLLFLGEKIFSMYGAGFSKSAHLLPVILLGAALNAANLPLERLFIAQGHAYHWAVGAWIGCGTYLLVTFALLDVDGASALAWGMTACLFVQFGIAIGLILKRRA